ncbi:MAG: hypothetical protein C4K60_00630 [Ideonella sp. MAG2]|nr:MAG: hypothetical protein C4K60_00630 [Ideonella sp. MAG2]
MRQLGRTAGQHGAGWGGRCEARGWGHWCRASGLPLAEGAAVQQPIQDQDQLLDLYRLDQVSVSPGGQAAQAVVAQAARR